MRPLRSRRSFSNGAQGSLKQGRRAPDLPNRRIPEETALEQQRSRLRQREDEFVAWVLENRPIRLPGAAAIFTAASSGIPLGLMHHLRHNRVLHERVLLLSTVSTDAPRIDPAERVTLVPVGAGITRVTLHFGFMEHPNVMDGLRLACGDPALRGIDPEQITYYFRRVMVVANGAPQRQPPGGLFWRAPRTGRGGRARS
ncbi:MAG: hypothetical protein E6G90_15565 [Alphaproteobacteria bacterium]|nr:MAG: hypothetical protein E6G90_15565 [Alphaproteobacteria bacterium]